MSFASPDLARAVRHKKAQGREIPRKPGASLSGLYAARRGGHGEIHCRRGRDAM